MAYGNFKTLARGLIHATQSIVYTGTDGKSTEVCSIRLHNTSNTNYSASVWFQENNQRHLNEYFSGSMTFEDAPKVPIVIQGTGSIYLQAQQSASISYIITGREEI